MSKEIERRSVNSTESATKHDQNPYGIDVTKFVERYNVKDLKTKEALYAFPTLCYLLGRTTDKPQGHDSRPDGIDRPVFYLTEGSGMFGLEKPEDADRWKGIFNHILGSARHAYFWSEKINLLTNDQKQQFQDLGFDLNTHQGASPVFLRDFMLINHAARRQADERKWHNLKDSAHPEGESESLTTDLLIAKGASKELIDLMRVEDHEYLAKMGKNGRFLNFAINILGYSDWTFGQKPNTLQERFEALRESKRQPIEILDQLEQSATYFEQALKQILGPSVIEEAMKIKPYDWEIQIREAYCSASGLNIEQVFPASQKK